jgi:flagellar protein FlbD
MIILTRLDGHTMAINEDLLVFAEKTPDTVLTMTSGQRVMVKESLETVVERIVQFRQRALPLIAPGAEHHG